MSPLAFRGYVFLLPCVYLLPAGASWQEVVGDTSMDDGDMARVLARTMDMLKQVGGGGGEGGEWL